MYSQTLLNPLFAGITGGGIVLDPEAAALIAAMTTPPDETRQLLINDFFVGLKSDFGVASIAEIFDIFYMIAAHDSQAARLNWVNPATFTITAVNSPAFETDRGYTGNGTTSYLNTGWNPSTNGVRYTLNNASLGIYVRTDSNINNDITYLGSAVALASRGSGSSRATVNSSLGGIVVAQASSLGMTSVSRTASTATALYRNATEIGTGANMANTISNGPMFIEARNNAGVADQFAIRQVANMWAGRGMNGTEHAAVFNRVEAFMDAIGAGVV